MSDFFCRYEHFPKPLRTASSNNTAGTTAKSNSDEVNLNQQPLFRCNIKNATANKPANKTATEFTPSGKNSHLTLAIEEVDNEFGTNNQFTLEKGFNLLFAAKNNAAKNNNNPDLELKAMNWLSQNGNRYFSSQVYPRGSQKVIAYLLIKALGIKAFDDKGKFNFSTLKGAIQDLINKEQGKNQCQTNIPYINNLRNLSANLKKEYFEHIVFDLNTENVSFGKENYTNIIKLNISSSDKILRREDNDPHIIEEFAQIYPEYKDCSRTNQIIQFKNKFIKRLEVPNEGYTNAKEINDKKREELNNNLGGCIKNFIRKEAEIVDKLFKDIPTDSLSRYYNSEWSSEVKGRTSFIKTYIQTLDDTKNYHSNPAGFLEAYEQTFKLINKANQLQVCEVSGSSPVIKYTLNDNAQECDTGLSGRDNANGEMRGEKLIATFNKYLESNPGKNLYDFLSQEFNYTQESLTNHPTVIANAKVPFEQIDCSLNDNDNDNDNDFVRANKDILLPRLAAKISAYVFERMAQDEAELNRTSNMQKNTNLNNAIREVNENMLDNGPFTLEEGIKLLFNSTSPGHYQELAKLSGADKLSMGSHKILAYFLSKALGQAAFDDKGKFKFALLKDGIKALRDNAIKQRLDDEYIKQLEFLNENLSECYFNDVILDFKSNVLSFGKEHYTQRVTLKINPVDTIRNMENNNIRMLDELVKLYPEYGPIINSTAAANDDDEATQNNKQELMKVGLLNANAMLDEGATIDGKLNPEIGTAIKQLVENKEKAKVENVANEIFNNILKEKELDRLFEKEWQAAAKGELKTFAEHHIEELTTIEECLKDPSSFLNNQERKENFKKITSLGQLRIKSPKIVIINEDGSEWETGLSATTSIHEMRGENLIKAFEEYLKLNPGKNLYDFLSRKVELSPQSLEEHRIIVSLANACIGAGSENSSIKKKESSTFKQEQEKADFIMYHHATLKQLVRAKVAAYIYQKILQEQAAQVRGRYLSTLNITRV